MDYPLLVMVIVVAVFKTNNKDPRVSKYPQCTGRVRLEMLQSEHWTLFAFLLASYES